MKLRFTPHAVGDLSVIADFFRERNPSAAAHVRAAILESIKILRQFPRLGRPQSVAGIRKLVTRRYSYLVYYTIDDRAETIWIVAIQHPARERDFQDA